MSVTLYSDVVGISDVNRRNIKLKHYRIPHKISTGILMRKESPKSRNKKEHTEHMVKV